MIRYSLRCAAGHVFESWFASAETYDRLAAAGELSCAVCGEAGVEKTLMAPALGAGGRGSEAEAGRAAAPAPEAPDAPPAEAPAPGGAPKAVGEAPSLSAPASALEAALRALRARVEARAENVGRDFARRAREMHAGEAPERAIYGEASAEEARELLEEGAPILPLPWPARRGH